LDICEEGAFTENELAIYEVYLDAIRYENAKLSVRQEEGEVIGLAKGKAIGLAEGERKKTIEIVTNSYKAGYSIEDIAAITGLTPEEARAIIGN
jgi:predicted transposase YdaD